MTHSIQARTTSAAVNSAYLPEFRRLRPPYSACTGALVLGESQAWWGILVMAVLGLWYIPFGALINIVVITLLLLPSLRPSVS